jgi:hypothetical protein
MLEHDLCEKYPHIARTLATSREEAVKLINNCITRSIQQLIDSFGYRAACEADNLLATQPSWEGDSDAAYVFCRDYAQDDANNAEDFGKSPPLTIFMAYLYMEMEDLYGPMLDLLHEIGKPAGPEGQS